MKIDINYTSEGKDYILNLKNNNNNSSKVEFALSHQVDEDGNDKIIEIDRVDLMLALELLEKSKRLL
jgi:hypothetical protein